jgi:hypothetical protein
VLGFGWAIFLIGVPTFTFAATQGTIQRRIFRAVFAGLVVGFIAAIFIPSIDVRSPGRRAWCANNLRNLAQAIYGYRQANGHYPPAYVADENGKPMHSWRVLILPFLDRKDIYEQYKFDEPWDGPNNRKLHHLVIDLYRCPSSSPGNETMTSYAAVVGPTTMWDASQAPGVKGVPDGEGNTLLVVEVADSGIHWMEPRDLHVGRMAPGINAKAGQGISSKHKGIANVAFADARVMLLQDDIKPRVLDALLTRDGGETLPPEDDWYGADE